jgi:hypothetical protein
VRHGCGRGLRIRLPATAGECREFLDPDVPVEWAGHGHLVDLGLIERNLPGG